MEEIGEDGRANAEGWRPCFRWVWMRCGRRGARAQTGCACWVRTRDAAAFYDVADAQTAKVRQMSATSPYLKLFPQALAAASLEGEREFELRLLGAGLNFEALWLHSGDGNEER